MQWYARQAVFRLDGDGVRADILCADMKGLLTRLPGLEALAFSDGTPFADEVTLQWINDRVLDGGSGWKAEPVAAVTAGDDILSLEPEVLAKADSEGIETALGWLQARPGYASARDQWLMRLLMARVSEQYGKMSWRCTCSASWRAVPGTLRWRNGRQSCCLRFAPAA